MAYVPKSLYNKKELNVELWEKGDEIIHTLLLGDVCPCP